MHLQDSSQSPYNSTNAITTKGWNGAHHSISDYNVFYRYDTSSDYDSSSDFKEKSLEWLEYNQKVIDGEIKYERYSRCLYSNRTPISSSNSRYFLHPSSCLTIYNENAPPPDKRHSFGSSRDHVAPSFDSPWKRQNSLHSCPEFSSNDRSNVNSSNSKLNSSIIPNNKYVANEPSKYSTISYTTSNYKKGTVTSVNCQC